MSSAQQGESPAGPELTAEYAALVRDLAGSLDLDAGLAQAVSAAGAELTIDR